MPTARDPINPYVTESQIGAVLGYLKDVRAWKDRYFRLLHCYGDAEFRIMTFTTPLPRTEWHEKHGAVLWWRFPISEPPYVGTPLDDDFPDYVTHWTVMPVPSEPYDPTSGPKSERL